MWGLIVRALSVAKRGAKVVGRKTAADWRAVGGLRGIGKGAFRGAGRAAGAAGSAIGYVARNTIASIATAGWAINTIKDFGKDFLPRASVSIRVAVQGSYWADINNLFSLACGVAFRRFPGNGEGYYNSAFKADIDWTSKIVTVELAYVASALSGHIAIGESSGFDTISNLVKAPIPRVLGWIDKFPDWMGGGELPVTGIDADIFNVSSDDIAANIGRPILTHFKDVNPPPAFDGFSRSSDFTAVLLQSLTNPCQTIPKPTSERYGIEFADAGVVYSGDTNYDEIFNKRTLQADGSTVNPIKQGDGS